MLSINIVGKLFSLVSFVSLFTLLPNALKIVWPRLLANFSRKLYPHVAETIFIILAIGSNTVVLGSYNLFMCFVYKAKNPFFQRFRVHNYPWPWQKDYENWKNFLRKTIGTVLFNNLFILPLTLLASLSVRKLQYKYTLEDWPTGIEIFLQFMFFLFMMDMSFYWSHRLLHHPKLYWIHKQHHQYNITITLAATYAHPIEFIFGNIIPYSRGFLILKNFTSVHIVSIIIWNFYGILDTSEGHSGYEWDWCQLSFFPWKLKANYHDFHHTHNSGNFGSSFGLWDTLMGTNKDYWKIHEKQS